MDFKEFMEEARVKGTVNEKTLWASMPALSEMFCMVKKDHPEKYWDIIREMHCQFYGPHYDEHFALRDVGCIRYTGRDGKEAEGAYWSMAQVEEATRQLPFPSGTTKWDRFVAFNAFYADTCQDLTDEQIIKTAHKFYFYDKDAPAGKIWKYMEAMHASGNGEKK